MSLISHENLQSTSNLLYLDASVNRYITPRRTINKLVLQISHECNMRCLYCCTDKGSFGSKKHKMMSSVIALDSLELFTRLFGEINNIYLFGGEPTLNLAVIDHVCEKIIELVEHGHLKKKPCVGLTTNGTLMDNKFIQLIKKYDLMVGVSLDGTQAIHDNLRVDSNGRGTYSRIIKNVRNSREQTKQPSSIELTYTPFHIDSSVSLWDTLKALQADTGINVFSVTPAFNTSYSTRETQFGIDPLLYNHERVIEEMVDAITKSMRSIATSANPIVLTAIPIFLQRFSSENNYKKGLITCPAGSTYFSIATDGTIYPCQNLPENCHMRIGHIYDDNIEMKLLESDIAAYLRKANDYALIDLDDSWLNRFLKVCPACNLSETNSFITSAPYRKRVYLSMAKNFSTSLFDIISDPDELKTFTQNLKKETT